jgi:RNA polymerase-binding transcription factor DksA
MRQSEAAMTSREMAKFRTRLQKMGKEVYARAESAEEQARQSMGSDAAGDLSNTPMHLGDLGTEEFSQELGATLLENEQYLEGEILAALDRIEKKTFGKCENCGKAIARERLEAIPYVRYCVACAEKLQSGRAVNVNDGRPATWTEGTGMQPGAPRGVPGGPDDNMPDEDRHAVGTPGGGTAVGGLAGTNVGTGEPDSANLEGAMGSGTLDQPVENDITPGEDFQDEESAGYSGRSGGAVGGTPANKRARGGQAREARNK